MAWLNFRDVFGLKKFLVSDEHKIAYNFAKKFFEYANGHAPSLKQGLELLAMIDPKDGRIGDLVSDVLVYSVRLEANARGQAKGGTE